MSLAKKAMLINLHISQWAGRKLDKKATNEVHDNHNTQGKVGQYTKKLLPGAKELEEVTRLAGATRAYFYEQTLPWFSDGTRMISSKNYLDFMEQYKKLQGQFDDAVDKFVAAFPQLREEARQKLGSLFNEKDYPSDADLKNAFSCRVSFMPLPEVEDFRKEILESDKQEFLNRIKEVEETAKKECWERLNKVVVAAVERLSDPKAIFRDSLIGNIQDECNTLPKVSLGDDPDLQKMIGMVEEVVKNIVPQTCRDSRYARKNAAEKLSEITDKMSVFMAG